MAAAMRERCVLFIHPDFDLTSESRNWEGNCCIVRLENMRWHKEVSNYADARNSYQIGGPNAQLLSQPGQHL